jgi:hypothetical protein
MNNQENPKQNPNPNTGKPTKLREHEAPKPEIKKGNTTDSKPLQPPKK